MPIPPYPPEAIALAKTLQLQPDIWERPRVQGITIDGPTSKDLDDAIWIKSIKTGAVLYVHIADVSELVLPGTILDKIAIARTQTRYLSYGNDPMLPHILSEDRLSLHQGASRPTLTVKVTLNKQAEIEQTDIFESWLRNSQRFSYSHCDRACKDKTHEYHDFLKLCQRWSKRLSQQREALGAFGGFFRKSGYLIDEDGNFIYTDRKDYHAQVIIQEFMILANRAVAQWLAERDLPALYRNHTAKAIAPERAEMLNDLLSSGNPQLIRQKMMQWLNRATYNPTLIGHFALNLPAYIHFTSPIRRLADLIVHRIVKAELRGEKTPYTKLDLEQLGQHIQTVTLEYEKASDLHFKESRKRMYTKMLRSEETTYQDLSEQEFSRLLKHAIKEQALDPLRAETCDRLTQDKLVAQDYFWIIFHSEDQELRQQVTEYLKEHPQDAMATTAIALDKLVSWKRIEFSELDEESPFCSWMEVVVDGRKLTTRHPGEHQRKQNARHQASALWLEAFINNDLVSPRDRIEPVRSVPEPEPKEPKPKEIHPILVMKLSDGMNHIGLLNQLCQTFSWEAPEYDYTQIQGEFHCRCAIALDDSETVTGDGTAPKKQRSKHLAAGGVLKQLQAIAPHKWGDWSGDSEEIKKPS